ncbi:MAG: serine hydrolase [Usitatibacteraceae bacterium]
MKNPLLVIALSLLITSCASHHHDAPVSKSPVADTANLDIGTARDIYNGALFPDKAVRTYSNTDRIFPTRTIKAAGTASLLPASEKPLTALSLTSAGKTYDLPDYVALNRVVGLLILKDGKVAFEHYDYGFTPKSRWMSMSMAKSIVSTLVGAAVKDGYIASINDPVTKYLPQLAGSAYEKVAVRDMMMMASGVKWNETYVDPKSDRRVLLELQIASNKNGAIFDHMKALGKGTGTGTNFNYNTGETILIGEVVQAATKMPLADYLSQKIWSRIGMESDAKWWLDSPNGHEVGGSGVLATLRDFGRFGQFILNGAQIDGQKIVPDWWLADATSAKPLTGLTGVDGYAYQWWTVTPEGGAAHEGAFMGQGIHGQYLYINPKHNLVVVALSARPKPTGKDAIEDLDFLAGVVEKLRKP